MILSDVSIKRPVFATVVSLLLIVLGIASLMRLPIREYPAIDPPVVSVTTQYVGASAAVVDTQITELIEAAVAGIEGIKFISSQSRDERSQVTIEFRLTRTSTPPRTTCATAWRARSRGCRNRRTRRWCRRWTAMPARSSGSRWCPNSSPAWT
jgi:hypothetical protein